MNTCSVSNLNQPIHDRPKSCGYPGSTRRRCGTHSPRYERAWSFRIPQRETVWLFIDGFSVEKCGRRTKNSFLFSASCRESNYRTWGLHGLGFSNFQFHLAKVRGFLGVHSRHQFALFQKVSPAELPVF